MRFVSVASRRDLLQLLIFVGIDPGDLTHHFLSQNRRSEEYILSGRYKNIIDPNQEEINTERKEKQKG